MSVMLRHVRRSASLSAALAATLLTVLYAGLRPAGPGFGRFGYAFEYDLIIQVLYPAGLAVCLVDVLYWRGRWVELSTLSARALTMRLGLCAGLTGLAASSVSLVWLASRVGPSAASPAFSLGDGGQLSFAIGNLALTFAFASFVAALFGAGAASLAAGAVVVAQLALGGSAGTQCHPATAIQLCPPTATMSPGHPAWILASVLVAFAVTLLGEAASYRRYTV